MKCLACSEAIDDDCCYCDLCGAAVSICPSCNTPVAGKWCTQCGKPSILAASRSAAVHASSASASAPAQQAGAPALAPAPAAIAGTRRLTAGGSVKGAAPRLRLRNKTLGIDLEIADNSVVGRTTGAYAAIFGSFDQVSGRHCFFKHDPTLGWCVTDAGSTNKTHYNNKVLAPNMPQSLGDGTYLKIANIEFFVSIGAN